MERTVYWGIECRTCLERIPLGIRLDSELGDISSFMQPGTFRCVHGHTHNYQLDDVILFPSPGMQATEAGIRKNRRNYKPLDSGEDKLTI
jgi:hypothetical protein